jgi:hypothetical protein
MMTRGREILLRKAFRLVWGEVQLQKIKPTEIVERFFNHQVRYYQPIMARASRSKPVRYY